MLRIKIRIGGDDGIKSRCNGRARLGDAFPTLAGRFGRFSGLWRNLGNGTTFSGVGLTGSRAE
jgi:hypothetical protein